MKKLFFLLAILPLFGTVNEPLRCEIFSGYRNDRIHWHLQDPGDGGAVSYSELYRDVEFWENGLSFKAIHRDLTFFLRGSYSAFGQGTLFQHPQNTPFTPAESSYQFQTQGWAADAFGYFGYAVNLTADRLYKWIVTPLIGYSGYFEQLQRRGGEGGPDLPGVFHIVWNGFFFGAAMTYESSGPIVLNAGYSYHILHNHVKTFVDTAAAKQTIETSSSGNGGQTGWTQIEWRLPRRWRLGIGAQVHYFFTRVVDANISTETGESLSQKFKLRWVPISGWAQISRSF